MPDRALAGEIERLRDAVLFSGEEATEQDALARARAIFDRRGIPDVAAVGDEAAYGFVLINTIAQPPDFSARFANAVAQVTTPGALPADAVALVNAHRRAADVERGLLTRSPSRPALRDEIEGLFADDQRVRQKDGFDVARMVDADRRMAAPLEAIVSTHGVPTYDMVGVDAAKHFIVMVQHQSPQFRRRVLAALEPLVQQGQADPGSYAMVYDRTQRDEKKNQRYGQQLECAAGSPLAVAPIDDEATVDMRRAEMGLMRLHLYSRLVREHSPDFCQG